MQNLYAFIINVPIMRLFRGKIQVVSKAFIGNDLKLNNRTSKHPKIRNLASYLGVNQWPRLKVIEFIKKRGIGVQVIQHCDIYQHLIWHITKIGQTPHHLNLNFNIIFYHG